MEIEHQKSTAIEFKGNATEYFGIWIVNLLLSLITLGIYSAWAKVRRKKYFYNNTLIDNVGFDYHAKPVSILKGRVIAFVFFFGYSASANLSPYLPIAFMLIFFIALPWLVVRGSIFNARNTSHRGLRFNFVGTVGQAFKVFIGLPLLTLITLGLAAPYVSHQRTQFLMNNHQFGKTPFKMKPIVNQYYMVYIKLMAVPVVIMTIGIIAAIALGIYTASTTPKASAGVPNVASFVELKQQPKLILAANDTAVAPSDEAIDADIETEPALADEDATLEEALTPEQAAAQAKAEQAEKVKEWLKDPVKALAAAGAMFIFFALYILFIFGVLGYLQARIGNLIWNNTTLDKLSFSSNLRARDFIWLYFSNILAIVFSFGLATPWAQVRMARYRAGKLHIVGDENINQFVGDKKAEITATGEEIADFFDVDLSFG
jgi:uncharacterized membrane protein YjgN (DUF898 family)